MVCEIVEKHNECGSIIIPTFPTVDLDLILDPIRYNGDFYPFTLYCQVSSEIQADVSAKTTCTLLAMRSPRPSFVWRFSKTQPNYVACKINSAHS